MRRRLPPLNALRAFEAAGRHLSFTRAADELLVTPGAVSRQVRSLEDQLGIQLFERNHREVKLTKAAETYCSELSDLFDHVERITKRVSADTLQNRELHVYASMTFTLRWLMPRLASFHASNPKQEIRLTAALPRAIDLLAGDIDIAITSFPQVDDSIMCRKLVDIDFLPVCSPKLLTGRRLPLILDDLDQFTLLDSLARPDAWERWLSHAGVDAQLPGNTIAFESSSLAYQAAIEGIGIAMGMKALVQDDLDAGRLVAPFDCVLRNAAAFHLVFPKRVAELPQVKRFRNWVVGQVSGRPS